MAYLARIEPQTPQPIAFSAVVRPTTSHRPDFSPLEWSVIRLARIDGLWTLRASRPAAPLRGTG